MINIEIVTCNKKPNIVMRFLNRLIRRPYVIKYQ